MKTVRWSAYGRCGRIGSGRMPVSRVLPEIQKTELKAAAVLRKTGADHVLYGLKVYGDSGELLEVQFYLWPMSEKEFDRLATKGRGNLIYALHRR